MSNETTSLAVERSAEWNERRLHNRTLALKYAKEGFAVFPSSGKTPLVPGWQCIDREMDAEQHEEIVTRYREKHGRDPVHVGATCSSAAVKAMWRAYPDAVPSISTGPSGLLVVDADAKHDGPTRVREFFEPHGGIPSDVPVTRTQSGGLHLFFRNEPALGCKAGTLKALGCDVRGIGGQVLAPGAWREDGRRYDPDPNHAKLPAVFKAGALPAVPSFVVEAIGQAGPEGEAPLNDAEPAIRDLMEQLRAETRDEFVSLFDDTVGRFPLDFIRQCRPDFGFFYDHPGDDRSANRMKAATFLVGAYPELRVTDYAVFCSEWDAAGDPDDRQLAREFRKATLRPAEVRVQSQGDAFEPVDDEDDGAEVDQPSDTRTGKGLTFEMEAEVAANAALPVWLVDEVIEAETLTFVYGPPNAGKSLALLDMLYHVAAGKPWRGREVKQGCVLYISVEGPNGTARRAKAWRAYHKIADGEKLPLAFIRSPIDLFNSKKTVREIIDAVRALEAVTGLPCRAVAIDTVNAVTPGMDENSPPDWAVFLKNVRAVLAETKAAIVPVHHTGKDETRGMRGSNTPLAAADTTLLVNDGAITTMKMRDGRRGQAFPFAVKVLDLWTNEHGKPVGAPVAVERGRGADQLGAVDADEDPPAIRRRDTREDRVDMLVDVARELAGQTAAAEEPLSEVGLSLSELAKALNVYREQCCSIEGHALKPLDRKGVLRVARSAVEADRLSARGAQYFLAA